MSGHATPEQRIRIEQLQARRRDGIASTDETLELALLALEPEHDAERAIGLLNEVPAEHPLRKCG